MKKLIIGLSLGLVGAASLIALSYTLTCSNCFASPIMNYLESTPINNSKMLVDVRTAEEFSISNMRGSVNISVEDILAGKLSVLTEIDKNTPIELYCRSGNRAEIAKNALYDLGFTNVVNLHQIQEINY